MKLEAEQNIKLIGTRISNEFKQEVKNQIENYDERVKVIEEMLLENPLMNDDATSIFTVS